MVGAKWCWYRSLVVVEVVGRVMCLVVLGANPKVTVMVGANWCWCRSLVVVVGRLGE